EYLILNDHSLLGFIGDELVNRLGMNASLQRYQGFRQALDESGIPFVDEWCRFGSPTQESAFELAYELLQYDDRPTAIVAAYDTLAFGIIEAARMLRLRVPQDVAVIGFDDIPAARIIELTTIRQPLIESGRIGVRRLLDWLAKGVLPEDEYTTVLPLEIIQRATV
ncbi:MAG TPA: substrate-binding domain-containing protein, partial [Aggregatilineales bacterium]|nr:substrate-binding domain-containing protein [Aggregatilineales bacterium]